MDREDLDVTDGMADYLAAFSQDRQQAPERAVTGPGRAPRMTAMDPDLAAYIGEFSADTPSVGSSSATPGTQEAIEVRVVQRALNVLTNARLAEDGDYGPLTQGALANWINTLTPDARQRVNVVPSADGHWLFITPTVIVQALRAAAARRAPRQTQSTNSVGGAAQVLLNAYNKGPAFARAFQAYAQSHGNMVPTAALNVYIEWYRSVVALQNAIVSRLRTDPTLQRWIASREAGAQIPSQMANDIDGARPPLPDIPQVAMSLGNPYLIALGIVAAAVAIPLVAHEISLSNIAANRTAQLEAVVRGLGEGNLTPDMIPELPGGSEDPSAGEEDGPYDWLPWALAAAAALGVVGLVAYGYVTKDKGRTEVNVGSRQLTDGDYEEEG